MLYVLVQWANELDVIGGCHPFKLKFVSNKTKVIAFPEQIGLKLIAVKMEGYVDWANLFFLCKDIIMHYFTMINLMHYSEHSWKNAFTCKQNWSCFMGYFKTINSVLENNISILKQIVWETNNGTEILVGQVVLKLLIKTIF